MKKLVKKIKDTSKGIFSSRKGFTLLELLIVVIIIGILAAIALPQYQRVKEKTIMAEGIQLTKQIAEANQRYFLTHGEYADSMEDLDIEFSGKVITFGESQRIKTNNFVLSPKANGNQTPMAVVQRIPSGKKYYIEIYKDFPNTIKCTSYNTATPIEKELCSKLNSQGYL